MSKAERRSTIGAPAANRIVSWLQLVRLPNLFTAAADVAAGFLFTHAALAGEDFPRLALLLGSSVLLYAGGVVLNDVFDYENDCRERPERPLPSGQISLAAARLLGGSLLLAGVVLAWLVAAIAEDLRPGMVATGLAAAILAYDGLLKQTPLGPPAMGLCRSLNLLLGMSVLSGGWQAEHALAAGAIGVYIAGVTWFARTEAERSGRGALMLAAGVVLTGIVLLEPLPRWTAETVPLLQAEPIRWTLLLTAVAALVGVRLIKAIADPSPVLVQAAVRHAILSLIVLDAAIGFVTQGLLPAAWIVLLLVPATFTARWIAST